MSKKKTETDLNEIIMRHQLQNYLHRNEQTEPYENAIQQAQADSLLHEQSCLMQRNSDMMQLAMALQKMQRELRKTQKTMDKMAQNIVALTGRCNKTEKKVEKLTEKVRSLCKEKSRQQEELKKYRLQMHQQKKILRYMGAYLGVNNPTDNLGKIVNKCSKTIGSNCMRAVPPIIDVNCREVVK